MIGPWHDPFARVSEAGPDGCEDVWWWDLMEAHAYDEPPTEDDLWDE